MLRGAIGLDCSPAALAAYAGQSTKKLGGRGEEEPLPLYRRVRNEPELPPVGAAWESPACDFKSDCDTARFTEMAKDIAAFSNATGGVIILRAAEARNRLVRYLSMEGSQADGIRVAYELAARDHCVPPVQVHPATIKTGDTTVLAINVDAYPAQPIGVRVKPAPQHSNDKFGPCFMFPIRTGTSTAWLTPDRLATIMEPKLRIAAIQLDGIPEEERRRVLFKWAQQHTGSAVKDGELVDVNPLEMTFTIRVKESVQLIRIPLSAFKVLDDEHMRGPVQRRIHIDGYLSEAHGVWQWSPNYP